MLAIVRATTILLGIPLYPVCGLCVSFMQYISCKDYRVKVSVRVMVMTSLAGCAVTKDPID